MRKRLFAAVRIAFVLGATLCLPAQPAAQLRVIVSGGYMPVYRELLPLFEEAFKIKVTTASGASQGPGPDTIGAMLRRGEPADLVIMTRPGLAELAAEGRVVAGSEINLAVGLIGVAMRAGAAKPDIRTPDSLRQALLDAKVIAVPGSTSATFGAVKRKLDIGEQIQIKSPGRGAESVAMVARGEAVFSIQPVSEILNVPGVELAGTLPAELYERPVFVAAIVTGSQRQQACKMLIALLGSASAAAPLQKHGLAPTKPR